MQLTQQQTAPEGCRSVIQHVVAQENVTMMNEARQPLGCRQCAMTEGTFSREKVNEIIETHRQSTPTRDVDE